jgi:hypothetical protein
MQSTIYNKSPENFAFGGGDQGSVLHPVVAVALVVVIVLMLLLPRKYIVVPVFLFVFLVPGGQQLYLLGVHFYCYRFLILFGCARLVGAKLIQSGKASAGGFNAIDGVFVTWALYRALAGVLQYSQMGAIINQTAFLWDAFGTYFLLRFLIQDQEDIERVFKVFAVVAVVIAAAMVYERYTAQNLFGTILGGVRIQPEMRGGKVRAQAVFQHSLLAGSFGAFMFPLFFWLWKSGQAKVVGAVGIISSGIITLAAASSTPILAYAAGVGAICMWPLRRYLRILRYGVVTALVALHLLMKAPVWFLIARVDLVDGSSGYHRALLVDQFVRHFGDWWLIGTHDNGNWGWDMWDIANQYVNEGERGGLVAFVCFLALIVLSFRHLAKARMASEGDRNKQWFLWLLGASLFANCVAFFGVDYFDQTRFAWYTLLVMIVAATAPALQALATSDSELNASVANATDWARPRLSTDRPAPSGVLSANRTRAYFNQRK